MKLLDYLNLGYIWLSTYPGLRRVWQSPGDTGEIRVSYGYDRVPGPDEIVYGGMVKLQDLNKVFPHSCQQPNILYLVSSALPYFPVRLAGMAKKAGAKLVINQNGVAYPGWYGQGWERQNRDMACLHAMADHVYYQSRFCQLSASKYLGKRNGNSEVLYNPVDTGTFCPPEGRDRDTDTITLLLAGSHWSLYRPKIALEVLALLSRKKNNVQLKIAGRFCWDNSFERAWQQVKVIAAQLGVEEKVEYVGSYTQQEAVHLLQSSSILLHTKYNDPCPRLVVEAMACGLPVVYSATGGVPELVGSEAGVGVDGPLDWEQDHPPDPGELSGAVERVMAKLEQYSQAARSRAVQKFDVGYWLGRHKETFVALQQR